MPSLTIWRRMMLLLACLACLFYPLTALAVDGDMLLKVKEAEPPATGFIPPYLEQLLNLEAKISAIDETGEATVREHIVQKGETLSTIAHRYGTTIGRLMDLNNLKNANYIREGQVLLLEAGPLPDTVHVLGPGETVWDLSRKYGVPMDEILAANKIVNPHRLQVGQEVIIPEAGTVQAMGSSGAEREYLVASRGQSRVSPGFIWPHSGRITSPFGPRWGRFHYGLDIGGKTGQPIVAAASGIVTEARWRPGYGNMVHIDHKNGWESVYAHASRLYVKSGQEVSQGQRIAAVGATGNATGPHLHLEFIFQGEHVNPLKYLP